MQSDDDQSEYGNIEIVEINKKLNLLDSRLRLVQQEADGNNTSDDEALPPLESDNSRSYAAYNSEDDGIYEDEFEDDDQYEQFEDEENSPLQQGTRPSNPIQPSSSGFLPPPYHPERFPVRGQFRQRNPLTGVGPRLSPNPANLPPPNRLPQNLDFRPRMAPPINNLSSPSPRFPSGGSRPNHPNFPVGSSPRPQHPNFPVGSSPRPQHPNFPVGSSPRPQHPNSPVGSSPRPQHSNSPVASRPRPLNPRFPVGLKPQDPNFPVGSGPRLPNPNIPVGPGSIQPKPQDPNSLIGSSPRAQNPNFPITSGPRPSNLNFPVGSGPRPSNSNIPPGHGYIPQNKINSVGTGPKPLHPNSPVGSRPQHPNFPAGSSPRSLNQNLPVAPPPVHPKPQDPNFPDGSDPRPPHPNYSVGSSPRHQHQNLPFSSGPKPLNPNFPVGPGPIPPKPQDPKFPVGSGPRPSNPNLPLGLGPKPKNAHFPVDSGPRPSNPKFPDPVSVHPQPIETSFSKPRDPIPPPIPFQSKPSSPLSHPKKPLSPPSNGISNFQAPPENLNPSTRLGSPSHVPSRALNLSLRDRLPFRDVQFSNSVHSPLNPIPVTSTKSPSVTKPPIFPGNRSPELQTVPEPPKSANKPLLPSSNKPSSRTSSLKKIKNNDLPPPSSSPPDYTPMYPSATLAGYNALINNSPKAKPLPLSSNNDPAGYATMHRNPTLILDTGKEIPNSPLYNELCKEDYFHLLDARKSSTRKYLIENSYLLRPSSQRTDEKPLTLCLNHEGSVYVFAIEKRNNLYSIGTEEDNKKFPTVQELINYYRTYELTFGDKTARLTYPSPKRI